MLEGCDGVHISISGQDEPAVVEAVVAAAPASGARRITYLSGATVHPDNGWFPMVAQKLRAEETTPKDGRHCACRAAHHRELDVLRLFRSDLSPREIANELYISHNTAKSYTQSIYRKLGVTSRSAALETASDLDLF